MTFYEFCAAIWNRRKITVTTEDGRKLTCVPVSVSCAGKGKAAGRFAFSYEQNGGQTRGATFIQFDSW